MVDFTGNMPLELNIIYTKIGIDYNQLVIEKLPVNKSYSFPIHSSIFCNNIMTISVGSSCVATFENKLMDENYDILIKRRSLLVLSDECRKQWSYKISTNKTHTFNEKKLKRDTRYTLNYKNIKFIDPVDDDDVYYFSY